MLVYEYQGPCRQNLLRLELLRHRGNPYQWSVLTSSQHWVRQQTQYRKAVQAVLRRMLDPSFQPQSNDRDVIGRARRLRRLRQLPRHAVGVGRPALLQSHVDDLLVAETSARAPHDVAAEAVAADDDPAVVICAGPQAVSLQSRMRDGTSLAGMHDAIWVSSA